MWQNEDSRQRISLRLNVKNNASLYVWVVFLNIFGNALIEPTSCMFVENIGYVMLLVYITFADPMYLFDCLQCIIELWCATIRSC